MTISQLKELSNEELRVRCAEACGWTDIREQDWCSPMADPYDASNISQFWQGINPEHGEKEEIPNYPESLDAMAEAEKTLSDEEDFRRYDAVLGELSGEKIFSLSRQRFKVLAEARQRAIAFVFVRQSLG